MEIYSLKENILIHKKYIHSRKLFIRSRNYIHFKEIILIQGIIFIQFKEIIFTQGIVFIQGN